MNDKKCKLINKKQIFLGILLLYYMIICTGCSDMVEIEDRDFVLTVGVELGEQGQGLKVTYARPDLWVLTGQTAGEGDKLVVSFEGDNFQKIEEDYGYQSQKRLDYSHLKAIIFQSDLLKDENYVKNILEYMEQNYEISKNTKVYITGNSTEELLSLDEEMSGNVGNYLENIYKNNRSTFSVEMCTLEDMINAMNNKDQVVYLPVLRMEDKQIVVEGLGLFDGKICEEVLEEEESKYIYLAMGKVKTMEVDLHNGYTVKLENIKNKYTYSIQDNLPCVLFQIDGDAKITDYNAKVTHSKNQISKTELEDLLNLQIKQLVNNLFEQIVKEKGIDLFNSYRRTSTKSRKIWIEYNNKHKEFLNDLNLGIIVEFHLENNL